MINKPCILLDLDETIIHSLSPSELKSLNKHQRSEFDKLTKHLMDDDYYTVIERPGLQPFLDFLFKNFNVSVWTAASQDYALFIIDEIILKKKSRKLDWILFSYHCKIAKKEEGGMKNLKLLDRFSSYDHLIILDDHPKVYKTQPDNCIAMKPFELSESERKMDNFLLKNVKPALEKILEDLENKRPIDIKSINEANIEFI